jgi:ribosomal protein L35
MKKKLNLAKKRLRVTKNKKIIRRLAQQGHLKAKETGKERRNKRKPVIEIDAPIFKKATKKYL